jgi:hypothetical protein
MTCSAPVRGLLYCWRGYVVPLPGTGMLHTITRYPVRSVVRQQNLMDRQRTGVRYKEKVLSTLLVRTQ